MNIFKALYLRWVKGYWHMDTPNKLLLDFATMYSDARPKFIQLGRNSWLVSPPRKANRG